MSSKPFFSLDGRVAMITGASRGIGQGVALVLAQAGAKVALAARDEERLKRVAEEIRAAGGEALECPTDVTDPGSVEAAVQRIVADFGRLDILVNNAGTGQLGSLEEVSLEDWNRVLATNLTGPYLCAKAAIPHMKRQRHGRIINISSVSAHTGGMAGAANYAASKGGLISFGKTLTRDLASHGITINAIAPGQIETDMGRITDQARLERVLSAVPASRLGRPEDIAFAVLFLASQEASYITGITLDVDGGLCKR